MFGQPDPARPQVEYLVVGPDADGSDGSHFTSVPLQDRDGEYLARVVLENTVAPRPHKFVDLVR